MEANAHHLRVILQRFLFASRADDHFTYRTASSSSTAAFFLTKQKCGCVTYWYGTGLLILFLQRLFRQWSFCGTMNPEEQTVTWLISLGVLSSPKKNIADPEEFLKTSLKDGVVLCKLTERLIPGFTPKVSRWLKSISTEWSIFERDGGGWMI